MLTWSARPGTPAPAVWRRRAAKIFPNHVATWLVVLLAVSATPAAALANLSLPQAWIPSESVYFDLNTSNTGSFSSSACSSSRTSGPGTCRRRSRTSPARWSRWHC
ncbi:hypothetical protein [Lentzea sp. CC55]|uniref:hypothetical protein n=1 Tax=Lentzea sp. CC55 TaxID=2884909 RepID=UPI001F469E99|nr:hypothetical protein [Lentzea sp. CC55]MCG8923381.1 hypothetical protein [Lentzea sp. CC55]